MPIPTDSSPTTQALLLESLDHNPTAGIKLCECIDTHHMLYVNDGLVALSGYSREELIGNSYALLVRPEKKDDLISTIKNQSKTQGYFRVTYQLKRKDGTFVWVLDSGIIRTGHGEKTVIQSVMMDISNHKKVKDALEASQRQYETALEFSDLTMFEYDIETKKILTQSADFNTYGMASVIENGVEEVIESGIIAQRSEEDLRDLYRAIDEGAPTAATVIYANDLKGAERTLELQMIAVLDDDNTPSHAVGVRKDITEAMLLHKEKEYSNQLTAERRFICEANVTQDKILYYNTGWAQEVGLSAPTVFSDVLQHLCEEQIDRNDTALFAAKPSLHSLQTSLEHNERLVTFEYRRRQKKGKHHARWFEATLNIVQDEVTDDISVRIYITNIDKRKQDELRAKTAQKRHELMLSKSTFTYELNLTKDYVTLGQENLEKELGLLPHEGYSTRAIPSALAKTHPEDQAAMAAFLAYDNLKQAYAQGTASLEHDYRYRTPTGTYPWRRISLQIFTDEQTRDLMCFASIEDIDERKKADLALIYQAQHDLMTGFYNKQVTREKIDAVLSSPESSSRRHVFFIVDLDYFKLINDHFGHAFGDAVLSQAASKIADLFRAEDILGRIGGDEFVIFMKNVRTEKLAFLKAQEICDTLTETYQQNGTERKLTASVGIAISNRHGTTYDELYRRSDTALYAAKKTGRHRYTLYNDDMQLEATSVREIDLRQICEADTFGDNISEYVFRILYESPNKQQAIDSVLDLVGKHYGISRIYIFENSKDGTCLCNTFEWCKKGISPQKENLACIPYSKIGDYAANFSNEGVYYLKNTNDAPQAIREILKSQNIKSMVQFSIVKNGRFAGFVGFDECETSFTPEDREFSDFRNFSNALSVFIAEMRALEQAETAKDTALSIVNGLDSYAYVCNPLTYELLFVNNKTQQRIPAAQVGQICHRALQNRDTPCEVCPIKTMQENKTTTYSDVHYNADLKTAIRKTASWINWIDDTRACLVNIADAVEPQKGYSPQS